MIPETQAEETEERLVFRKILLALGILTIVTMLGVYFAFRYVAQERERAVQQWQVRLSIVAESRAQAVSEWVSEQRRIVEDISENQSLRIYLSELSEADWRQDEVTDGAAQAGYLSNLLMVTAERSGFLPPYSNSTGVANVNHQPMTGGLIVLDKHRNVVASSGIALAEGAPLDHALNVAIEGEPHIVSPFRNKAGQALFGFSLPIYGIQDDTNGPGLGVVIGLRPMEKSLYSRLVQPGDDSKTAENHLIAKRHSLIDYLSPTRTSKAPLAHSLNLNTPRLAASFALEKPGEFAIKRDYGGREVLVTSRSIEGIPWLLMRTIGREEALTEIEQHHTTTLTAFLLLIVGVTVTIIAVWRHGTSVRSARAATKYRMTAERFENLTQFLRVLTDTLPTEIIALDGEGRYTFANMAAAHAVELHPREMKGKTMAAIAGPVKAGAYAAINGKVFEEHKAVTTIQCFEEPQGKRVIKSSHTPLAANRNNPQSVLMVLDDITELTREQEKAGERLMQLVETLVSVVDRRDPFSANHSARVGQVSRAVGEEMGLPVEEISTLELAGRLMNLGKIYIPTEILTKTDQLSEDEKELLAGSIQVSADILQQVDFEGPVVDTIRQLGKALDGNDVRDMASEETLRPARIVAIANTFVGMVSPRAYRNALSFEDAANRLLEQGGAQFDRKAVLALVHYLENRGGKEQWAHFRESQ
ncbi:MAG: PAS domain-containing protein [Magnetococcales bacterium]|nr:PAS domain-containing protein [Magnetococcales bacterium]